MYGFYGVDNNCFRLSFGGEIITLEAEEDEDDGYRSYLRCINVSNSKGLIFFSKPIAFVKIVVTDSYSYTGFEFRDLTDDHVWLRVGTDEYDETFPYFVFDYSPKKG